MLLLNFAAERYWVQNVTALILAIVWVPRWLHAYGIPFKSRPQYVGCTQYMATGAVILDVEIVLYQCLEEIAKKEAQFRIIARRGPNRRRPRTRKEGKQASGVSDLSRFMGGVPPGCRITVRVFGCIRCLAGVEGRIK
jgi:hypothetical protein